MRILVFFLLALVFPIAGFAQTDSSTSSRNKAQTNSNQVQKQSTGSSATNAASDSQRERNNKEPNGGESNQDDSSTRKAKNGSTPNNSAKPNKTSPAQNRPTVNQKPSKNDFLFSFDRLPTFAEHDRYAAIKENLLPVKFPVLPIYNVSEELPGYLDLLRRVSMMTLETVVQETDESIKKPWDVVVDESAVSVINAELDDELTFKGHEIIKSRAGDEFWIDQFEYRTELEVWDRLEITTAQAIPEGYRYIKVLVHSPKKFNSIVSKEMRYYVEEAIINPYKGEKDD